MGPTRRIRPPHRRNPTTTDPVTLNRLGEQVRRLVRWADDTTTGDRAELEFEPQARAWAMVSTTARDCPGAFRCPSGRECFAEEARTRAAEADVVVVNTHLYGAHLASGGAVLPPHQVVVFDEAHEVEAVIDRQPGGRDRTRPVPRPVLVGPAPAGPGRGGHGRHRRPVGRRRRTPATGPPTTGRHPGSQYRATPAGHRSDGRRAGVRPGRCGTTGGAHRVSSWVSSRWRPRCDRSGPSPLPPRSTTNPASPRC